MAEALRENTTLFSLNLCKTLFTILGSNRLKVEGAKEIVSIMKDNITLRELFIGGNDFREEGGNAVATGILSNRSITTLDLGALLWECYLIGWNDIGPEAAKTIAEALKENNTLLSLAFSIFTSYYICSQEQDRSGGSDCNIWSSYGQLYAHFA